MKTIFFLILIFAGNMLYADDVLYNQEHEKMAKEIFSIIRCVTCKGQSIKDSHAEIALILRKNILSQIQEGRSEQEILEFLKIRYGEDIILKPSLNKSTILLWSSPILLLVISLFIVFRKIKFSW